MMNFGQYLSRLALNFWLGEMLFFIVIFAPRVFKVLPRDAAGQLQAAIFPAYYAAGLISAGCLLVGLALRYKVDPHFLGDKTILTLSLVLIAALVFAYSLWSLTPELNAIRPSLTTDVAAATRFAKLHKLSVQLNSAALLCLLALLALI